MQYLLTKEEYEDLINKANVKNLQNKEQLQELCTNLANHMPVLFWDNKEPKVWGCIRTSEHEWYCDNCPAQDLCPTSKNYSK